MKILDSRWTPWTFLGCLFFILHGCLLLAPLTESHIVNPSSAILLPRRILTHEKVLRMGHHSLSPHTRQLRLAAVQQQISRNSRQAPAVRALYSAPDIPTPEIPALYSAPGVVDERASQNDNDQDKVTTEVYLPDDEFEDENSSENVRYGVPTENYNDMMIDDEETSMEQDSQSQTESPQPDLRYLPPSKNDTDLAEMDDSTENSYEAVTVKEPSEKYGPPQESGNKFDGNMKPALPKQEKEMDLPPGYLPPVYNPPKAQAGKAAAYDLKETEDFGQRPPDSGYNTIPPSLNGKANNGLSNEQRSDSARNQVTNEDEFEGLNEKIVDAELLNRVKQIIDDHEQQQRTAGSPNSNLGHGTDIQYLPPRSGNGSPSGYANTPTQDVVNQSSNVPKIDIQKAVLSHHYTDAEQYSGPNVGSHEENRINDIAGPGQAYLPPRPLTNSPPSGYSNQIDTVQYELPKFEHQNSISSYWPSTSASSVASTAPQSSSGSYYYDSHSGQSTPRPNYGVPLAPVLTLESYTTPNNVQPTGYNAYSGAASQPATGEYLPPYQADSSNRVDDSQSNGGSVPSTLLLSPSSTYFTYQNVGNFDSSPSSVPTSLSTEFSLPSQEYSSHTQNNLLYSTGLPSNHQYFYQSQNPGDSVPHYYSGDTLSSTYSSSAFQRTQRRATPSSYSYIHRGVSHG